MSFMHPITSTGMGVVGVDSSISAGDSKPWVRWPRKCKPVAGSRLGTQPHVMTNAAFITEVGHPSTILKGIGLPLVLQLSKRRLAPGHDGQEAEEKVDALQDNEGLTLPL